MQSIENGEEVGTNDGENVGVSVGIEVGVIVGVLVGTTVGVSLGFWANVTRNTYKKHVININIKSCNMSHTCRINNRSTH